MGNKASRGPPPGQAEASFPPQTSPQPPPPPPHVPLQRTRSTPPATCRFGGSLKPCGAEHSCILSGSYCCACSDLRPVRPDNLYEAYSSGRGGTRMVPREKDYCIECKEACRNLERISAGETHELNMQRLLEMSTTPAPSESIRTEGVEYYRSLRYKPCSHLCQSGPATAATAMRCCACSQMGTVAPNRAMCCDECKRAVAAGERGSVVPPLASPPSTGTRAAGGAAALPPAPTQVARRHSDTRFSASLIPALSSPAQGANATSSTTLGASTPRSGAGSVKACGHDDCLLFTAKCCFCADTRPVTATGLYPRYQDGLGVRSTAHRAEYYCALCKRAAVRGERRHPATTASGSALTDSTGTGTGGGAGRATNPGATGGVGANSAAGTSTARTTAILSVRFAEETSVIPRSPSPAPSFTGTGTGTSSPPSSTTCPVCASSTLFAVTGFPFAAMCTDCSSVFPNDMFSRSLLRALPVLSHEEARLAAERINELASAAAAARQMRQASARALLLGPGLEGTGSVGTLVPATAPPIQMIARSGSVPVPASGAPNLGLAAVSHAQVPPPACVPAPVVAIAGAGVPPTTAATTTSAGSRVQPEAVVVVPTPAMLGAIAMLTQLQCTICLESYTNPVTLPTCGHTFCHGCIVEVADTFASRSTGTRRGGAEYVSCPICRTVVMDVSKVAVSTEMAYVIAALKEMAAPKA